MSRTRELLRSVRNLSILRDLTRNQGALETMGDPGDNFIDSDSDECLPAAIQSGFRRSGDCGAASPHFFRRSLLWRYCQREPWIMPVSESTAA